MNKIRSTRKFAANFGTIKQTRNPTEDVGTKLNKIKI